MILVPEESVMKKVLGNSNLIPHVARSTASLLLGCG